MPEKPLEMLFPFFGLDVSGSFDRQRAQTCVDAQNVRAFDPVTGRGKGAARPGLGRFVAAQVGGAAHLIQHLAVVVSVDGDSLLDNYDDDSDSFVGDPSDGGRGRGRRIRYGGSGRQPWKLRKRTPIIDWSTPSDITQGTALDSTQLNAAAKEPSDFYVGGASVSGTYTYTPASGTVLPEGDGHVLTVQFTPDDTLTWRTPPKKKVRINVTASGSLTYTFTAIVLSAGSTAFDYNCEVTIHPSDNSGDTTQTVELNTVPPFTALTTAPVGATPYTLTVLDNTSPFIIAAETTFDSNSPNQPWPGTF